MGEAMKGKTTGEIAQEYGVSRQVVSKVLNSDEAKALVSLGTQRIHLLMSNAIDTLEFMMDNKQEFGMAGSAFQSAKAILKTLGVLKESVDLNHNFPKPCVIKRSDGTEVVLGTEQDLQENK